MHGSRWRLPRVAAAARLLRQGGRTGNKRTRTPALDHDRDWRLALNNAVRTAAAISLVNAFWYVSEWPSGEAAVTWVGISSVLLANRENSAEATYHFLLGAALAELVGTTLHYTVLTFTGDFRLLAATLFPLGMLAAIGRGDTRVQVGGRFGLVVFAALEPLNRMEFDFGASLNGVAVTLLGLGTAVFAFSALPPPAAPAVRRRRAQRRIARALRAAACRPRPLLPHASHWCARMLERADLLAPEGEAAVAAAHTLTVAGLLLLSLRREQDALGLEAGRIVLAGGPELAGHLTAMAERAEGVQHGRLLALAALFPHGPPPDLPLSVRAA